MTERKALALKIPYTSDKPELLIAQYRPTSMKRYKRDPALRGISILGLKIARCFLYRNRTVMTAARPTIADLLVAIDTALPEARRGTITKLPIAQERPAERAHREG